MAERYQRYVNGSLVAIRILVNHPEDRDLPPCYVAELHFMPNQEIIAWATGETRVEALQRLLVTTMRLEVSRKNIRCRYTASLTVPARDLSRPDIRKKNQM